MTGAWGSSVTVCETPTAVAWGAVVLFWGDERCVPPDHPESNYRMAREALLSRVPIPETHIPAQIIRPARGRLEWLLDRDAASRLSPSALYHQPAKAATDGGYEPETIDPQITQMTQIVSEKSFREIGQSV